MPLRALVVDDFEPWRSFVSSILQKHLDMQNLLEVSDGLEAVYKAGEFRPDIIVLDVGLPTLNGIEAARRFRDVSPNSRILFLSEEGSPDVAEVALEAGGAGYVVKSDAGRELLTAVKALSEGKRYIGARLVGQVFFGVSNSLPSEWSTFHKLQMYSSEASFLDGFASFIAGGLSGGNAVVVLATEPHRQGLSQKLQAQGFDLDVIIESGAYTSIDAREALSSFMVDDVPDPDHFENIVNNLVETASKSPNGATRSVFACGECAPTLWMQGRLHAALRVEELWDAAVHKFGLSTLCGYISRGLQGEREQQIFQRVCAAHSAVIS